MSRAMLIAVLSVWSLQTLEFGPLVPQLFFLSSLQNLEVYECNLTGSIPNEIGNLKKLESIDLFGNRLSGEIPASLGNLTSLNFLRLNSNKLSGSVPVELLKLIQLRNLTVNFSDNLLDCSSPICGDRLLVPVKLKVESSSCILSSSLPFFFLLLLFPFI